MDDKPHSAARSVWVHELPFLGTGAIVGLMLGLYFLGKERWLGVLFFCGFFAALFVKVRNAFQR
jgi:hypothetical protein